MDSGKKILITGATGFLGRHLFEALHREPSRFHSVALVRTKKSWGREEWARPLKEVELIEGSVTESELWKGDPKLEGLSGIFHLAAVIRHSRKNPEDIYHTNIEGLLAMIRLAKKYRCRVVFVSTSGTVGCFDSPKKWANEDSPYCEETVKGWPYYHSKIQAEKMARELAAELGVELVIIRPPVLLGPGDHRHRATSHLQRMLERKLPFILNGGMHFIDIRDAAPAILKAMEIPKPKPVYHLVGTECSIPDFFRMAAEITGVPAPKLKLPSYLARTLATASSQIEALLPRKPAKPLLPDPVVFEMAAKYWGSRSRYAEKDLGYHARDPRQTLQDTVNWLKKAGLPSHPKK
jgi:nucleoside-diphosphate-sugar epimerase